MNKETSFNAPVSWIYEKSNFTDFKKWSSRCYIHFRKICKFRQITIKRFQAARVFKNPREDVTIQFSNIFLIQSLRRWISLFNLRQNLLKLVDIWPWYGHLSTHINNFFGNSREYVFVSFEKTISSFLIGLWHDSEKDDPPFQLRPSLLKIGRYLTNV